jgi:hypothetical protein
MKIHSKVQTYKSLRSFVNNSQRFLSRKESLNNLFWEVCKRWDKKACNPFSANVFQNGIVRLSAIKTPSDYLLLSNGDYSEIIRLVQYAKKHNLFIRGVMGPASECKLFTTEWGKPFGLERMLQQKDFQIFETPNNNSFSDVRPNLDFLKATVLEWPRVRLWAISFARESQPPLSENAMVGMAKEMVDEGSMFILREGNKSVAMGGFGRFTPQRSVINMVYVPSEQRSNGFASTITYHIAITAAKLGYAKSILFSDYLGRGNLYKKMGWLRAGDFTEITFN